MTYRVYKVNQNFDRRILDFTALSSLEETMASIDSVNSPILFLLFSCLRDAGELSLWKRSRT